MGAGGGCGGSEREKRRTMTLLLRSHNRIARGSLPRHPFASWVLLLAVVASLVPCPAYGVGVNPYELPIPDPFKQPGISSWWGAAEEAAWAEWERAAFSKMERAGLSFSSSVDDVARALNRTPRQIIYQATAARDGVVARGINKLVQPRPGSPVTSGATAGEIASRMGVLMAVVGVDWAVEQSFGKIREIHADGSPCDCGVVDPVLGERLSLFGADYWSTDHFLVRDEGWFADADAPGEYAYLLPGFQYETEFLGTYTLNQRVSVPVVPSFVRQYEWTFPPGTNPAYAWTTSCELLKPYFFWSYLDPDYPLQPMFSTPTGSGLPAFGYCYFQGWYDQVTGVQLRDTSSLGWRFGAYSTGERWVYAYENEASKAEAWAASTLDLLQARLDYLTDQGLIVPDVGTDGADGLGIPAPDERTLPTTLARPAGSVDASSGIVAMVDSMQVPDSVPDGVAADPSVDLDRDQFNASIGSSYSALRASASARWPFAGFALLRALASTPIGGADGMEWLLDVTPPYIGVQGDPVQVWVRPLEWLEPIKPYRWVFVGAVAIAWFFALYHLLKPRLGV